MNTTTVVKRGIYTVPDLYNGTLRAVVIFVDAKIQFLEYVSKSIIKKKAIVIVNLSIL